MYFLGKTPLTNTTFFYFLNQKVGSSHIPNSNILNEKAIELLICFLVGFYLV
jgi:hypothetical protein